MRLYQIFKPILNWHLTDYPHTFQVRLIEFYFTLVFQVQQTMASKVIMQLLTN